MKDRMCADCAGFDLQWMHRCDKHKTEFCRGCSCPECHEENLDEYEDLGCVDLEDQLDWALSK